MPLLRPTFFTSKHHHIGGYEALPHEFGGHSIQSIALGKMHSRDSADDDGAHVTGGRPEGYTHLLRTWSLGAVLCLLSLLLTALSQCSCCVGITLSDLDMETGWDVHWWLQVHNATM